MKKAASKSKSEQIDLLNDCYCSQFSVYPADWDQTGADPSIEWYVFYRFYDPAYQHITKFKKGKLVIAKGMNGYTTLRDKREFTKQLLEREYDRIVNRSWNPIAGVFMAPAAEPEVPAEPEPARTAPIMPEDGLWRGLVYARTNKQYSNNTPKDVDSYLRRFLKAAQALDLHTKPLGEFRRRDVLSIMAHINNSKPWSCYTFNNCIGYIKPLFDVLIIEEAMTVNPFMMIEKKDLPEVKRDVLTDDERIRIDNRLRKVHNRFWLFVNIFFHSGGREIELLNVTIDDVDLENQVFYVITRKGKKHVPRREERVIKDAALPFWREYLQVLKKGEYIFSRGFFPGDAPLSRDWVTHVWHQLVKVEMGIDVDLYALKHLNYTETRKLMAPQINALLEAQAIAAAQAGHKSLEMGDKHYDIDIKAQRQEIMRGVPNALAPKREHTYL